MKKHDLVLVEWYDANAKHATDQFTEEDVKKFIPCVLQTVGWIFGTDAGYIHMGAEKDMMVTEFRHVCSIPRANILTVSYLLHGKKTKKYD